MIHRTSCGNCGEPVLDIRPPWSTERFIAETDRQRFAYDVAGAAGEKATVIHADGISRLYPAKSPETWTGQIVLGRRLHLCPR